MKPVSSDVHFPSLEASILKSWQDKKIIQKGLEANKGKDPFIFYDGPPFATGLPHYGHILPGTLKDIVPRYWVMKGKYVERRWGWDCHGVPVEFEMEKELNLAGLQDVQSFGISKFNEACRSIVQRYTREWEEIIYRTGRWVDFKNSYRTMDFSYMETVWWLFRDLWNKGLIFKGHRVMPYSWRISTPLSNFEASLNYKEVQDPALTVRFKERGTKRNFLAWTTTPWTLPSNLALAVNPELIYVEILDNELNLCLVMGKERLSSYYDDSSKYQMLSEFKGKDLEGKKYEPLFPHFKEYEKEGAFQVLLSDHVTVSDGTGIVHMAPAFGEEDFSVCKKYKVPIVDPVDAEGKFTKLIPEYAGLNVKEADKLIIKDLKINGSVIRHETVNHNYPFCWRSDTPLIYKAISTWFVKLDPLREKLMLNNKKTHWVPEHLRDGRFGNWLENARDWNISRNRFWGTPLPVWLCTDENCEQTVCIGSAEELRQLSAVSVTDLHKHLIDHITFPCKKCGSSMQRTPEVLDCWFESGAMPFGQKHYPFENKEYLDKHFQADFIAEGIDQTRGWFYTLSVLGTAIYDKPPFKNVIVNGMVLAEDGKKMSKRLKNYPDVTYILKEYGADALRAYLSSSPASHAEDLRFSESGVKEMVRSVLLPLWNAYSFFVTYARADGWEPENYMALDYSVLSSDLDRWIVSKLNSLIQVVDEKMANYHLYEVVPEVISFIDQMTNWYIRINRRRFWSDEKNEDKRQAYNTLCFILTEFSKILAPILPFITEEIYLNLSDGSDRSKESVHLESFPSVNSSACDIRLEKEMVLIQSVVSMGRNLRNTHRLKTRQPLKELLVITTDPNDRIPIEKHQSLIVQELNIKKVSFGIDESKWVKLSARPNSKVLGPRLGPSVKVIGNKIRELSSEKIALLLGQGFLEIDGIRVDSHEIFIDREPKEEGVIETLGSVTVWLDTRLDERLIAEGRAREIVNRIQKLRKEINLEVIDRIKITFHSSPELCEVINLFKAFISSETLCEAFAEKDLSAWTSEQEVDGMVLKLYIEKL